MRLELMPQSSLDHFQAIIIPNQPDKAIGNLAANSLEPNILVEMAVSQ